MAHSYTPGLKVLHHARVNKNRRLPIRGSVTKKVGDSLEPNDNPPHPLQLYHILLQP